MLIDASNVSKRNHEILQASKPAMENILLANAAIDVLRSSCDLNLTDEDQVTVLRLAVRLINAAGSAGDAACAGYYQPAASQIRDIIEVGFLLDLFRRDPSEVSRWRLMEKKKRRTTFSAYQLRCNLDALDGVATHQRADAYQFFSQHGTHADPDAIGLTSPNQWTEVGPFPDHDRVIGLSFDLARYLAAATEYLIMWIMRQKSPLTNKSDQFFEYVEMFRQRVQAMASRETAPRS